MTLDECEQLFFRIRGTSSEKDVQVLLTQLFVFYKTLETVVGRHDPMWRARLAQPQPYGSAMEMSFPPASITRNGRLNDAGAPHLYLATQDRTAILEVGASSGDYVQLAGYLPTPRTSLRLASVGELFQIIKTGASRFLLSDYARKFRELVCDYMARLSNFERERMLFIDAFLASILEDSEASKTDYVKSRAIASLALRDARTEGVIYPSKCDATGVNLIVRPSAAERKLQQVACLHAKISIVREFGLIEIAEVRIAKGVDKRGAYDWSTSPVLAGPYYLGARNFEIDDLLYWH